VKRAKKARELKDKLEVCCGSPEFQHDTILIQIQRERQEEFEHDSKRRGCEGEGGQGTRGEARGVLLSPPLLAEHYFDFIEEEK